MLIFTMSGGGYLEKISDLFLAIIMLFWLLSFSGCGNSDGKPECCKPSEHTQIDCCEESAPISDSDIPDCCGE